MRIALTDVLPGGQAGATVVHLEDPYLAYGKTLCGQYEDGRVAHRGTALAVDCMTCLVRATEPSLRELVATALHVPKEYLYGSDDEEEGPDYR